MTGDDELPPHPGTITYLDGDTVVSEQPVDQVPESLRYAYDADDRRVPIVRVVARTHGDTREIFEYAEDGRLMRTTLQRRRPG